MSDGNDNGGGDGGQGGVGGGADTGAIDPLTGRPVEATAGGGDGGDGGDGGGGDSGAEPDWYQNISADPLDGDGPSLRDWIKSAGVKDLDGLAKIARDNQKALRESGRIKIPGEGASAAEVAEFHKAMGVPDDPSGYATPEFKDADGNPVELDTDQLTAIFASAHKRGGAKDLVEGMVSDYIELQRADIDQKMVDLQKATDAVISAWGGQRPEKEAQARNAIRVLGLTGEEVQGLKVTWGPDRALNKLVELGAGLSEDSLIMGQPRRFGVSGAEAQASLNSKRSDPVWVAKAVTAGTPENAEHERLVNAIAAEAERQRKAA